MKTEVVALPNTAAELATTSPVIAPIKGAQSFRAWNDGVRSIGGLPLVVIAGSRGKSTIAHLIHSMLGSSVRSALRTDRGVWIKGDLQAGEIGPWSRALDQLAAGDLDLAIWEVDWPAAQIFRHSQRIGGLIVSNVCSNRQDCLASRDVSAAMQSLNRLGEAVSPRGFYIVNGDDYSLADLPEHDSAQVIQVGLTLDSPAMRRHFAKGRRTCWLAERTVCLGDSHSKQPVAVVDDLDFTLHGAASFEIDNAMMAAAAGWAMGLRVSTISSALRNFAVTMSDLPGSFNMTEIGGVSVVVDRPEFPWFLQPAVRAMKEMRKGRLITICAELPPSIRESSVEIGRMLARNSTAVFAITGRASDGYDWESIRKGAAQVEFPPLVVPYTTVSSALKKALAITKPSDSIFVVTDHPEQLGYLWS